MKHLPAIFILLVSCAAHAWDEYGYDGNSLVEIEKGNVVRRGRQIELYDYATGEYRDVEVQSTIKSGYGTEIEVYDYDTGTYRIIEMEK